MPTISWKSSPYPNDHPNSIKLSHVICLLLLRSNATTVLDRQGSYRGFFQSIRCSDSNWDSRMFEFTHTCATIKKFSIPTVSIEIENDLSS